MTHPEISAELGAALTQISQLLAELTPADWHRPQGHSWTMAQEMDHLLVSTRGTAALFSPPGRAVWRPNDRPSTTFAAVRDAYVSALASRPIVNNPMVSPNGATANLNDVRAAWQTTADALLRHVANVVAADLDAYTVWKHPLIGPLTGREMLYFTRYHTQHHHASLSRKQGTATT